MPTLTMLAEQERRRAALLLAAVAVVAALLAAGTVLAVADPQGATPASPPTRVSSSRSGPSPTQHTTARPRITTVAQALTTLRAAIADAVNSSNLDLPAATDLDNRITDISRSLCNLAGHDRPR